MSEEEVLKTQLCDLKRRHAEVDAEVEALADAPLPDQLAIRRLKKEKLRLKDEIARIIDVLYPDIIA